MAANNKAMPRHIAIVMDGNGRWASKRFLPRIAGHKFGLEALKRVVRACADHDIPELTVFAFSSENWKRPAEEVSGLMDILVTALAREIAQLRADGVCVKFVGDRLALSAKVQEGLTEAERATGENTRIQLNVCFNYGGRWDIVHAVNKLIAAGQAVTQDSLNAALLAPFQSEPDLLIRTGGEMRLSNFLLWQSAYSELVFTDILWPDFDAAALDQALASYASRERRFGAVTAQPASPTAASS